MSLLVTVGSKFSPVKVWVLIALSWLLGAARIPDGVFSAVSTYRIPDLRADTPVGCVTRRPPTLTGMRRGVLPLSSTDTPVGISSGNEGARSPTHTTTTKPPPRRTTMCRPATCKTCGKTTWAGCGQHVDQVMAGVRPADRCPGHPKDDSASSGSFLSRLFGRK